MVIKEKSDPSIIDLHSSLLFNFEIKVFFSHFLFGVVFFLCTVYVIQEVERQVLYCL